MIKVEDKDFQEGLADQNYIVKFGAEWCGPCKALHPVLVEVEKETGITVYEVDVDDQEILASKYQIRAVPTTMFFKAGQAEPVAVISGATNKHKYLEAAKKFD